MEYLDINTDESTSNALQKLSSYTNLTFLSPGSKARLLVEILGEELGLEAERLDQNVGVALIRNSKGKLLDYIGEVFGMTRLSEVKASVFSEEENFMIYTLEPNFGAINNGEDINIPVGAINIYSTPNSSANRVAYKNTQMITLPRNSNRVFFAAEALYAGENSNVGANSLVFHDFTNYADSLSRTLLVTNNESITYGRNEESDDNFRFRIQREKISGEAGNETAIRLSALLIPGVSDIVKIPYSRGIGTNDWLIRSTSTLVSSSLIDAVQNVIDERQSAGMSNLAKAPNIVGLELSFPLTYKTVLEDSEKEKIRAEIRKNLADYINNLAIGEKLILDQLVRVVLNSSDKIESIGDKGSASNFTYVFIHQRSGMSNSVIRKSLLTDYKTKSNERVILEPRIESPILIKDNN
ncbi:MAG: baseplate J/gp47 family protein [Lachnospiraceae bacterium]|nr:baseplate J/gp47 family protein [Lachnospiraceae bacterium]